MSDLSNPAESALGQARRRGAVDDVLLDALRTEPFIVAIDRVAGSSRPAARELGGQWCVLAWTSDDRAKAAGWEGPLVQRPGREVAQLLLGTGLSLALNPGEELGVRLDEDGLIGLAGPAVPRGTPIYLGQPEVVPEQLESALLRELAATPGVGAARLALLAAGGPAAARRLTVVLSLSPGAGRKALPLAYAACDRAAASSRVSGLDVVLDADLGNLRATALDLPTVFTQGEAG